MNPVTTLENAKDASHRLLSELSGRVAETVRSCGEDQVHDLRVATRRFNQALRTFEACFEKRVIAKVGKRLKKTLRLAGCVRNLDVAMKHAARWKLPGQDHLTTQRDEAARELTRWLARWVERGWTAHWRKQLKPRSRELESVSVQDHARRLLSEMAAGFFCRGDEAAAPAATPIQMHGFRIAAKKFRYTMELFAPAYGPALDARIGAVRKLQTVLGELNDCVTLCGILQGDLAAGRLRGRQRRKIAEFRKEWRSGFSGGTTVRDWVQGLALLSSRKGPQREPACRQGNFRIRTLRHRRRRTAGGA